MAKFREPKTNRVNFSEDIKQDRWNKASNVDSTVISKIEYHPEQKKLRVQFRSRSRKQDRRGTVRDQDRKGTSGIRYTFFDVPVAQAQKFVDAVDPRRKQLPSRSDSVGASFRKQIRAKKYEYTKTWLEDKK